MRRSRSIAVVPGSLVILLLSGLALYADSPDFERDIAPILQSKCSKCHGAETQEADVRLDQLSTDVVADRRAAETWHEVLNVIGAGEMPPEEEPQLDAKEVELLSDWLSSKVREASDAMRQSASYPAMRRLSRDEYQNTMRDLLGVDMDYARDLPPDAVSADGFRNDAASLQLSAIHLDYYLQSARRAMRRVIVDGEAPKQYEHRFTESKCDKWQGKAVKSNRLGRQQEFLAKMKEDYPERGICEVEVTFKSELKDDAGYPLLEASIGYCPDTQIIIKEMPWVEITSDDRQTLVFRGRLEDFPLPVRGQGKYPGLVVRVRNVYDDGSPLPKEQKGDKKKRFYPEEQHLPLIEIEEVVFRGPVYEQWPPSSHRAILPGFTLEESPANRRDYVEGVVKDFMTRAYRRPVRGQEVERMMDHYDLIRDEFPSFEATMRELLAMVLIQPDFLYRIEPAGEQRQLVDAYELASRLSYFLTSTMPDEQLLDLAKDESLLSPQRLKSETLRLLSDPRHKRFTDSFVDQWLQLDSLDSIAVNKKVFRGFEDDLKDEMRDESREFFDHLLTQNLPATKFLDSPFAMLNEPLARHYGIAGIYGQSFRVVDIPEGSHRRGLLGQASVLMIGSTGEDSHPIRRAVWIRDRLLNDPPAPPPPDVPGLDEVDPSFRKLSIRDQLEAHRKKTACNGCHRGIDPWGIAMENLDAVGLWREHARGKKSPIVAKDQLPGGIELSGVSGVRKHLLERERIRFARALISRLLSYALGRPMQLSDEETVNDIELKTRQDDYRLADVVIAVVQSRAFKTK